MSERVTSVALKRGLFALRYVRASTSGAAPAVWVQPAPGCERDIDVISAPGERDGLIVAPGGCLVVRAEQPGTLQVTVQAQGGGSTEAELQLEPLHAGQAALGSFAAEAGRPANRRPDVSDRTGTLQAQLDVVGHVSRRGDVGVSAGQWIAGPDAPAPIEGLAIRVNDLPGVSIEYQVLIAGSDAGWSRWTKDEFVGTRGKFKSLHGVRLRLTGAHAASFEIEAEALFLGSATTYRRGREIELSSNASADPLVGLKLALIAGHGRAVPIQKNDVAEAEQQSGSRAGRVRVFRASGMRS